jgi:hypothetical protein
MNRSKSALTAGLAAAGLICSLDAGAFSISAPPGTPVEFAFNLFDASTVSYTSTLPVVCASTTACDTAAGQPPGGAPNAYLIDLPNPAADAYEDSWGVGNVGDVTNATTGDYYWQSSSSERMNFMFYGIVDDYITYDSGTGRYTASALGGYVDLYTRPGSVVNNSGGPAARIDLDSYPTVDQLPAADLFLRIQFAPGVAFGDTTHTFQSTFSTGTVNASGLAYGDVIGGYGASLFDTNGTMDPNGGLHDFQLDITITAQTVENGWLRAQGQMAGEVPVPAPALLIGGGLFALAGLRRRRQVKAA